MERSPFFTAARSRFALAYLAFVLAVTLIFVTPGQAQDKPPLLVFAAASLKNALDEINSDWSRQSGVDVRTSYAASSALAKQIDEGAPADLFLSADIPWMDHVEQKGLVREGTRANLLGNALVLIAPKDWNKGQVTIARDFDLAALLGDGRLAVGAVASVPAGRYAKAALETLGVWSTVERKLAEAENVRAALTFVSRGEAPLGIVYSTDAAADPNVIVVGSFPADSHPPIVYPVAVLSTSTNPEAERYRRYLGSAAARQVFEKHGFSLRTGGSAS